MKPSAVSVSIHAPVKARPKVDMTARSYMVSIHAPVKARRVLDSATSDGQVFQSTRP